MRVRSRTPSPVSRRSPSERGIFLDASYRMHPEICSFISSEFYDGRLHSHPCCAERSTSAGTGLRLLTVEHVGNVSSSKEEATAIGLEIAALLGETITASGWRAPHRPPATSSS